MRSGMVTVAGINDATLRHVPLPNLRRATHYMSMPVAERHHWTIDEVERLIEEREGYTPRYELVDGELLVTPSPNGRHQRIVAELFLKVNPYVRQHRLGEARLGPGAVRLTPDGYFEPDLYVVPSVDGKRPRALDTVTRLLLAAEVLSPGSVRHDRITKRRFFLRRGVPEYWVVDGDAEAFEVWHPGERRGELLDEQLVWHPNGVADAFVLDVRDFFASVADEG